MSPPATEGTGTTGTRDPPHHRQWRGRPTASRASSLRSLTERPLTPSGDRTEMAPIGVGPWSPVMAVKLAPKLAGGDKTGPGNKAKREKLLDVLIHFTKHQHRMRY